MFTSRAEHRLVLRQDNADLRLTPLAHQHGLVDPERMAKTRAKQEQIAALHTFAAQTPFEGGRLIQWLKRPESTPDQLPAEIRDLYSAELWEALEIEVKYAGYIVRQNAAIEKLQNAEEKRIPAQFDYMQVAGLRLEARQKLNQIRPETFGQASRISGITPADLALLSIVLKKPAAPESA
jgi:tRNA uridine 5-carboxymethylaminomethyl modification enzyme